MGGAHRSGSSAMKQLMKFDSIVMSMKNNVRASP